MPRIVRPVVPHDPSRRTALLASVSGAALALTGCGGGGQALRRPDLALMQQTVADLAQEMLTPGILAVLRTPDGEFKVQHGTTERGGGAVVDVHQHLRVGSNTKTWVGTVILQQADQGLLKLEDPVSRHWPGVPNGANITIGQLLNMRSGLYNYSESLELNAAMDNEPQRAWQPQELLAIAFKRPPYFLPGAGYHYSNTNTILLGLIAQRLDNKPLAQVMHDRLFAPLGMSNTLFPSVTSNDLPAPRSRGYVFGTNVETIDTAALSPQRQAQARAGTLQPSDQTFANPSWGWAAGAGISTAADLLTWVEALGSGRLLSSAMQQRRLASVQPINPSDPDSAGYGYGVARFGSVYGHSGELPGYNSFMGHDPVNKVTLVVWANLAPAPDGRGPASTVARVLLGQVYYPNR